MKRITKLAPKLAFIVTLFTVMAAMGFVGLYLAVGPGLPDVETIKQIRLQTPMSIYSKDGQLIDEFGDIRRIPITLDQVPQDFINALLSTEDQRFYEHSGVDFKGVLRAVLKLVSTGTKSQGASTITMLVARNYYLTREKRFSRKFTEMFVAWKLESELTKNEILEIFLNKIAFGHRSAGLGAAAQVYYGKTLDQLNLSQLATLAGIPKGQSVFNPISRPDRAKTRRNHVLGRMLAEGFITQDQFSSADQAPIKTYRHGAETTVSAPYLAEMVRREVIRKYGRDVAANNGLRVFTSINPVLQQYAQESLRVGLLEYDRRHGFRPVEQHYDMTELLEEPEMISVIGDFQQIGSLIPALVLNTASSEAEILLADGRHGVIFLKDSLWARRYIDENYRAYEKLTDINQIIVAGDVVRVSSTGEVEQLVSATALADTLLANNSAVAEQTDLKAIQADTIEEDDKLNSLSSPRPIFKLSQLPEVAAGFVVLDPQNGAIEALVGGFNYIKNKFNMVTQARRQIGSNIKPFIYSAALNNNYTAASIINDSPIIDWDSSAGVFWRPENDNGNYRGPMRLRRALSLSVNTVSIRLIRKIGARYAKSYLQDIGFPGEHMRPFPSLALGSASFTPLEVATGYSVLANGGYKIAPWFIDRIEDNHGRIIFEQEPVQVCEECMTILNADESMKIQLAMENGGASNDFAVNPAKANEKQGSNSGLTVTENVIQNAKVPLPLDDESWAYDSEHSLTPDPGLPIAGNRIAERVIEAGNRYIIDDMLKDVIHKGTASRTLSNAKSPLLRRNDLAGKTGTTNESKDAWFSGYNRRYVASAWVGFVDHSKKLGNREFGAVAALPIWRRFMEKALDGAKQINLPRPEGIVDVKIDLSNGKLASASTKKSDFEVFRINNVPTDYSEEAGTNVIEELDEIPQTLIEESSTTESDENENEEIDFD